MPLFGPPIFLPGPSLPYSPIPTTFNGIPDGSRYIIQPPATGDWVGKDNQIATWVSNVGLISSFSPSLGYKDYGTWSYTEPIEGMVVEVNVIDSVDNSLYNFDGDEWNLLTSSNISMFINSLKVDSLYTDFNLISSSNIIPIRSIEPNEL